MENGFGGSKRFQHNILRYFMLSCLYHLIENWGNDLAKIYDFQRKHLSLVYHVIQDFSALRARPLSSQRKMGDELAKIADFQRRRLNLVLPFYLNIFRAARATFIIS